MKRLRPRLLRTVGFLTMTALLGLNAWLVALNLDKHDRLPLDLSGYPGFDRSDSDRMADLADPVGTAGPSEVDGTALTSLSSLADADTGLDIGVDVDSDVDADLDEALAWPGGRGPPPVGPPVPRVFLLAFDGRLRVTGSAPSWSVVTALVDDVGRRSGLGPLGVDVSEVTWHPESSARLDQGEVRLERPLLYDAGEVGLPADGAQVLAPVVELLRDRPELAVVLVAHIDDLGDSDANAAVALARAIGAAEALEEAGVDSSRVMSVVAPSDPAAPVGSDEVTQRFNRRVDVRIENLLLPAPAG